ncbi:MAG TPA: AMP-binding protein, partial [Methylomirabilota bacterium]|nr:AMP-binding protein [Methylomirabilota bacterium]
MTEHQAVDTLARMFWRRVERSGDRPAQMVKRGGGWETLDWSRVGTQVREVALGLLALGLRAGDAVAILSRSRAEWVQADFAIFSAGGVTVPIYPSYTAEQVAYIVNDAEARVLIVEDDAQLAKVLEVRGRLAGLGR